MARWSLRFRTCGTSPTWSRRCSCGGACAWAKGFQAGSPVTGARVPVRQVADVRADWQASRIVRRNGVRTLTVRSYAKDGVLASSVLAAVKPSVARLALPDGYAISYGGELENQAEVEAPMAVALGVSLIGIFGILFFQFRTIRYPLIVMVSIPLALFGSALGLIITRNPFGFTANLGLTALTGVVVRNAIILVEYIIERRQHGVELETAALEAGRRRLRPIFLTTMAAAAGVIPMILSGSTLWSPLASVLAVGLVCSMVFTLVVVPVLFVMVERRAERGAQPSVVTPVTKPHLTRSPATLVFAQICRRETIVAQALGENLRRDSAAEKTEVDSSSGRCFHQPCGITNREHATGPRPCDGRKRKHLDAGFIPGRGKPEPSINGPGELAERVPGPPFAHHTDACVGCGAAAKRHEPSEPTGSDSATEIHLDVIGRVHADVQDQPAAYIGLRSLSASQPRAMR